MNPKELFGLFVGKERGEAIQDLEISLRAKVSLLFSLCCCHCNWTGAGLVVSCFPLQGSLTQAEDATLRKFSTAADVAYAASSTFFTLPLCFSINKAHKLLAIPPPHRLLTLAYSAGGACVLGKLTYYQCHYGFALNILNDGEERMKMELANIILTKHSNEKSLVKAVKRHFIAEHLFRYQHQDGPLFSWRQRHSYVDSSFVEREKEECIAKNYHITGYRYKKLPFF
ncbi:uncharacterized protein LOC119297964 isoform X1 [Triticum dicoccoides]|uniref:uncharacterized protein LOC119297964 isoform X1 n=1 Tax=Triticum dicoccoides TaxID=85692 RepID=UPI00188ECC3F|nr:uncharacterized protein LOC119297964 isoform X1 [Triticum dicoccoides]